MGQGKDFQSFPQIFLWPSPHLSEFLSPGNGHYEWGMESGELWELGLIKSMMVNTDGRCSLEGWHQILNTSPTPHTAPSTLDLTESSQQPCTIIISMSSRKKSKLRK